MKLYFKNEMKTLDFKIWKYKQKCIFKICLLFIVRRFNN